MLLITETLPRHPRSVSEARAIVVAQGNAQGLDVETRDVAKQLTSELVTNCVRHGAGLTFRLRIERRDDRLRVEVIDSGSVGSPQVRTAGQADLSGRGLFLVDKLSLDWGIEVSDCTKVWFEVPLALSSSRAG